MTTTTFFTVDDLNAAFSAAEVAALQKTGADAVSSDFVLSSTNSEIASYLGSLTGGKPLASIPQIVKLKGADLARFYLYTNKPSDAVKDRYEKAVAWFTAVATGTLTLALDFVVDPAAPAAPMGVFFVRGTNLDRCEYRSML